MVKGKLVGKAEEVVRYRPQSNLRIYSDKLPVVKDLKVGDTCTFLVTAKVKSVYEEGGEYGDDYEPDEKGKKVLCATLRIKDIKEEE